MDYKEFEQELERLGPDEVKVQLLTNIIEPTRCCEDMAFKKRGGTRCRCSRHAGVRNVSR